MTGVVCTPLRTEWLAVSPGLSGGALRTGRSRAGHDLPVAPRLITGVAGSLRPDVAPGDLVVASEVRHAVDGTVTPCPASALLVGALRRAGHTVHHGPVVTTERVVDDPLERAALAADGALAVDTESALLLPGVPEGQAVVVRAIVDTPEQRLFSLGTAPRGIKALLSLRKAAPVLEDWVRATADREVVLASPRSFCAGVERAIDIVAASLDKFEGPVYVRRQIVHNRHVVAELEAKGAIFVEEVEEVPEGSVVVLAAHGVTPTVRQDAAARHLRVVDATCPLVTKVHNEVRRFAGLDHTVFLIGHADHEEVVGTYGEAPGNVVIVEGPDEAMTVEATDPAKVSYVMQTTLAVDEAEKTATILRERFPALSAPRKDDICYATTNRQQAVRAVARDSDLVIVLGSRNSSNSQRLVEVARGEGTPAYLVDDLSEVDLGWLYGAGRIGLTAGASAPPHLVDEVVAGLAGLGRLDVHQTEVVSESVRFTLPREVISEVIREK
ncbi:4-hydroxy-3-methylbut-2-enyl diphosphate reductase [Nocardioides sp. DS6]|uniref:4-hydroxy-3-methylbut-2-enyl diphosphate reductase n=1 Tax=Nocardioides eburneus TaxID=3231482 RepID=A0ABV3SWM7_9ACTN